MIGREGQVAELIELYSSGVARAVVVRGPVGVGKTSLVAEFVESLRQRGCAVLEAVATESASTIQLGALAHLLPALPDDPSGFLTLQAAHNAFRERGAQGRRTVLFVDDAHALDDRSATLLLQLVVANTVFLIVTVRKNAALPVPLASILHGATTRVLELSSLSTTDAAAVVHRSLEGPVDPVTTAEIVRLAGGNPTFLLCIIQDGVQQRTLELADGIWRSTGSLVAGQNVKEITAGLLADTTPAEGQALELLAIAGSIPFSHMEELAGLPVLEKLEEKGLVCVDPECPVSSTRLSSDLLSEALLRQLPRARLVHLSRMLAEVMADTAHQNSDSVAIWRLDAGGVRDAKSGIAGARRAMASGDFLLAERFARASLHAGAGVLGWLLLSDALTALNRLDEAAEVLATAHLEARSDEEVARAALAQMRNLHHLADGTKDAAKIGAEALARIASDDWKDEIAAELSLHAGLSGNFIEATALGERVLARPGASDRAVVSAGLVATQGQVMLGRLDEAIEVVERGLRLTPTVAGDLPMAEALLHATVFQARLFRGDLAEAEQLAVKRLGVVVERRDASVTGLWTACVGAAQMFLGKVAQAAQTYRQATCQLTDFDPLRALPVTQCWRAMAQVQAGMVRAAEDTVELANREYLADEFRITALQEGVAAWVQAQLGDGRGAALRTNKAGSLLIDHTHIVWGCLLLHNAVRFGYPGMVVDELTDSAAQVDGLLIPAMARHAQALASAAGPSLEAVSMEFANMGAMLLAAEAAFQAAAAHESHGERLAAGRASARATGLLAECDSADTPALRQPTRFLTMREEEIARMAVAGLTSREIADGLTISIRTVDNHLGAVYTKLGISGRTELSKIMHVPDTRRTAKTGLLSV